MNQENTLMRKKVEENVNLLSSLFTTRQKDSRIIILIYYSRSVSNLIVGSKQVRSK